MSERTQRRLAAIVSTDVVGYSRLMGRDETGTLAAMRTHRKELWNPTIEQFGGRIVGTAGDAILIEFASAVAAVESSIAIQLGMTERNADLPRDKRMLLRIGVQKSSQKQVEQFCRSLFTISQEAPDTIFAIEPGRELDDLLGFEAMGWVLDDLTSPGVKYWHDVGRIHMREKQGLPAQGAWLDSFGARMAGIHLQDAAEEEAEMPIGIGEVDFQLLAEYVPRDAERVLEISPRHGRAEILASVQFLVDHGF